MPKQKKPKVKPEQYFAWVIAYIDSSLIKNVEKDLDRFPEYEEVQAYIPTVKILKKTFKNKDFFEEVPLLFNYGFFKIPRKYAMSSAYLENLQKNVGCIFGWVKDPAKLLKTKPRLKSDNKDSPYSDNLIPVATAHSNEVARLISLAVGLGAHSADDLSMLKVGDTVTLRGYPFEGMQAEYLGIDEKKKKVRVKIEMFRSIKETLVSFDNVFFTIYHNQNFDDSLTTTASLEDNSASAEINKKLHKKFRKDEQ